MNQITARDFAPADPILPLYQEWRAARATWYELADLPENGNWDMPESLDAEAREEQAFTKMIETLPTTQAGLAALVDVLWSVAAPDLIGDQHVHYAERLEEPANKLMIRLWRATSGHEGLPPSAFPRGKRPGDLINQE